MAIRNNSSEGTIYHTTLVLCWLICRCTHTATRRLKKTRNVSAFLHFAESISPRKWHLTPRVSTQIPGLINQSWSIQSKGNQIPPWLGELMSSSMSSVTFPLCHWPWAVLLHYIHINIICVPYDLICIFWHLWLAETNFRVSTMCDSSSPRTV